jgi:hypothetical protein
MLRNNSHAATYLFGANCFLIERMNSYDPPENIAGAGDAGFSQALDLSLLARTAVLSRLVFDSADQPAPAGVRGSKPPVRHLLYETSDLLIDFRLETESGAKVFLTGQALTRKEYDEPATAGAMIELLDRENQRVARTTANSIGEFHLDFDHRRSLTIYVKTSSHGVAAVPLPDPDES